MLFCACFCFHLENAVIFQASASFWRTINHPQKFINTNEFGVCFN